MTEQEIFSLHELFESGCFKAPNSKALYNPVIDGIFYAEAPNWETVQHESIHRILSTTGGGQLLRCFASLSHSIIRTLIDDAYSSGQKLVGTSLETLQPNSDYSKELIKYLNMFEDLYDAISVSIEPVYELAAIDFLGTKESPIWMHKLTTEWLNPFQDYQSWKENYEQIKRPIIRTLAHFKANMAKVENDFYRYSETVHYRFLDDIVENEYPDISRDDYELWKVYSKPKIISSKKAPIDSEINLILDELLNLIKNDDEISKKIFTTFFSNLDLTKYNLHNLNEYNLEGIDIDKFLHDWFKIGVNSNVAIEVYRQMLSSTRDMSLPEIPKDEVVLLLDSYKNKLINDASQQIQKKMAAAHRFHSELQDEIEPLWHHVKKHLENYELRLQFYKYALSNILFFPGEYTYIPFGKSSRIFIRGENAKRDYDWWPSFSTYFKPRLANIIHAPTKWFLSRSEAEDYLNVFKNEYGLWGLLKYPFIRLFYQTSPVEWYFKGIVPDPLYARVKDDFYHNNIIEEVLSEIEESDKSIGLNLFNTDDAGIWIRSATYELWETLERAGIEENILKINQELNSFVKSFVATLTKKVVMLYELDPDPITSQLILMSLLEENAKPDSDLRKNWSRFMTILDPNNSDIDPSIAAQTYGDLFNNIDGVTIDQKVDAYDSYYSNIFSFISYYNENYFINSAYISINTQDRFRYSTNKLHTDKWNETVGDWLHNDSDIGKLRRRRANRKQNEPHFPIDEDVYHKFYYHSHFKSTWWGMMILDERIRQLLRSNKTLNEKSKVFCPFKKRNGVSCNSKCPLRWMLTKIQATTEFVADDPFC